jgi:multiple sugar transport system permease protein
MKNMSQLQSVAQRKVTVKQPRKLAKSLSKWTSYFFVIPSLLFIGLFMLFPIAYNLIISFQNVTIMNLAGEREFVGLLNYINIFKDLNFTVSMKNSFLFTAACLLFQFMIGFAFALFYNQKFPGRDLMRSLMLLAWMLPIVITATLFKWMLSNDYGIINYVLLSIGIIDQPIHWLTEVDTSLIGTVIGNVWVGIPFNMIILLSALQSLPEDLYEAAKIDGANRVQRFFHITIPLLKPTILILLMLGIVYTFKVFDLIFIMTAGGPVNSSTVLPLYAYQLAFQQFEFSMGAAVATVMFVILSVFASIYLWMIRKEEQ